MGLLDSITGWLRRESRDISEATKHLEQRLDADLSTKERELSASPSERIEMLQDEIDGNDSALDSIRDRIQQSQSHADAVEELNSDANQNQQDAP